MDVMRKMKYLSIATAVALTAAVPFAAVGAQDSSSNSNMQKMPESNSGMSVKNHKGEDASGFQTSREVKDTNDTAMGTRDKAQVRSGASAQKPLNKRGEDASGIQSSKEAREGNMAGSSNTAKVRRGASEPAANHRGQDASGVQSSTEARGVGTAAGSPDTMRRDSATTR
jgi:hypothetical protein